MTEYHQIEEALKECEEKFSKAFRESPLILTLTRAKDHRYIDVNDTFERITGWNRNEVIGRTPFDLAIWVDPSQRLDFVKRLLAGDTVRNLEVRARMKDGKIRTISGSAVLIKIKTRRASSLSLQTSEPLGMQIDRGPGWDLRLSHLPHDDGSAQYGKRKQSSL